MELKVEFTACCPWPDFARAVRNVLALVLVILVVLVAGGQWPVAGWPV